jgi:hypothetical protein
MELLNTDIRSLRRANAFVAGSAAFNGGTMEAIAAALRIAEMLALQAWRRWRPLTGICHH